MLHERITTTLTSYMFTKTFKDKVLLTDFTPKSKMKQLKER